jgi:hypothetical protein
LIRIKQRFAGHVIRNACLPRAVAAGARLAFSMRRDCPAGSRRLRVCGLDLAPWLRYSLKMSHFSIISTYLPPGLPNES